MSRQLPLLVFLISAFNCPTFALQIRLRCPDECYQNSQAEPQKTTTTTTDQCPCVKPPGSNTCLTYDNRLQATSIEEALYKFPDFVNYDNGNKPLVTTPSQTSNLAMSYSAAAAPAPMYANVANPYLKGKVAAAQPVQQPESTDDYTCNSYECQSCKALVINGFAQNAGVNVSEITTTPATVDQTYCQRKRSQELNRSKPKVRIQQPSLPSTTVNQIMDLLQPKTRKRRASTSTNSSKLLGVATKIGCDYRRGDEIISGWTGLCNLCWQWRKLPDDYYPVFLNEVSCDDSDQGCLAGFGGCRSVLRSINVLRNLGTVDEPKWEQQSINTIAACECQVELGTPLHSLVSK